MPRLPWSAYDRNWEVEEVREAHERPKELKVYSRRPRAKN